MREGGQLRAVIVVMAVSLLAVSCSSDKPAPAGPQTTSEETLRKNCADPKWRDQNLGLWYSVCRQPMRW